MHFSVGLRDLCASVVVILGLSKDYHRETEGTREARSRPIGCEEIQVFRISTCQANTCLQDLRNNLLAWTNQEEWEILNKDHKG